MKRTLLSMLVIGLFAGVGTSAIAQMKSGNEPNVDVGSTAQHPAKAAKPSVPPLISEIDSSDVSAEYSAAKNKAQADYTDAKIKCDTLKGSAVRKCMKEARTARTEALVLAKTQRDNPGEATGSDSAKRGGTSTLQQKLPAAPLK